jgi:hypothetical protein
MSRQLNTVNAAADTFGNWVIKTNDIVLLVNTDVVTVEQNTAGDLTVGNGYVIGIFGSNTLVATDIRGGSVTSSNVLLISSNANFTGSQVNSAANVYVSSSNTYIKTTSATTFEGNVYAYANTSQQILGIVSNATHYSINANVNNGFLVTGNTNLYGALAVNLASTFSNTVGITGATTLSNTLNVVGAANLQSTANVGGTLGVVGTGTFYGSLVVNGAATFSNTIAVTGNATFSNTINVTGNATFVNVYAAYANIANLHAVSLDAGGGTLIANSSGVYGVFYSNSISSSTNGFFSNSTLIALGNTSVNTMVTPTTITSNTGYFYNLNVTGSLVGTFSATGNFIPSPNNVLLIGTSSNVFNHIYATNTYTNSISSFSGNLNISTSTSLTGNLMINSNNVITSGRYVFLSGSSAAIDSFPIATYRSGEYMLQMNETGTTNYHVSKLVVYHDDTTAYSSEFAQLFNNTSLGTVTTDVSGGNVRVLVAPASSNVIVKYSKNLITV